MSWNIASPVRGRWTDSFHQDCILVFGGTPRTLDLLRLAVIRSDDVILVATDPDERVRSFAASFAVDLRRAAFPSDFGRAATVLVGLNDNDTEMSVVLQARAAGIPVHVADRPDLSDFNLLEFVERRAATLRRVT